MNYNLIQNSKFKIQNSRKAFTLIELLVAIAIIGILAAVVLVSMKSYGVKARSSKVLAEYSSAIPSMISCWGNGGDVNHPYWAMEGLGNDPAYICGTQVGSGYASYGAWPRLGIGDLVNYKTDISSGSYCLNGECKSSKWFFSIYSESSKDNVRICCNSTMNGCKILNPASSTCNVTTPSN